MSLRTHEDRLAMSLAVDVATASYAELQAQFILLRHWYQELLDSAHSLEEMWRNSEEARE